VRRHRRRSEHATERHSPRWDVILRKRISLLGASAATARLRGGSRLARPGLRPRRR
jgi:hypothetical protein